MGPPARTPSLGLPPIPIRSWSLRAFHVCWEPPFSLLSAKFYGPWLVLWEGWEGFRQPPTLGGKLSGPPLRAAPLQRSEALPTLLSSLHAGHLLHRGRGGSVILSYHPPVCLGTGGGHLGSSAWGLSRPVSTGDPGPWGGSEKGGAWWAQEKLLPGGSALPSTSNSRPRPESRSGHRGPGSSPCPSPCSRPVQPRPPLWASHRLPATHREAAASQWLRGPPHSGLPPWPPRLLRAGTLGPARWLSPPLATLPPRTRPLSRSSFCPARLSTPSAPSSVRL